MRTHLSRFVLFSASLASLAVPAFSFAAGSDSLRIVTREELTQAMRQHGPYDITRTTNAGRLQAETILHLVRDLQTRAPDRMPLLISHKDWFGVYIDVAGVTAEQAPLFARLGHEYGQDLRVEYRPERVIRSIKGPQPKAAFHVTISWEDAPAKQDHYSYEDTLSTPHLQVTDHRVITYHLLDFGDMVVMGDVRGLTGRPTTGLLGFLFRMIGEGQLVEVRIGVAPDGLQVVRGTARKGFMGVTTTATIYPDGRGMKGLPDGREDLRRIEDRLKVPIEVEYVPTP